MKKILTALALLAVVGTAQAHGGYYGYRGGWVAPFVVGAGVGYIATRPYYYPPYYAPQPVVIQQPVYIQQPNPSPTGYHYESILDANCNCYRSVLVPNQ
jgi:hypothetical protein